MVWVNSFTIITITSFCVHSLGYMIYNSSSNKKGGKTIVSKPWIFEMPKHICMTSECQEAAIAIKESLNTSANPCEDFFEFTCGQWITKHPVPPSEAHENQFDVVTKKLDVQLKDILEEDIIPEDPYPVQAAKRTYKVCMDTGKIENDGLNPLWNMLQAFGGWPIVSQNWDESSFIWQKALVKLGRKLGSFPLFLVYVYYDRADTSRYVINIDQPAFVLPRSMLTDPETYLTQIEAYQKWIVATAKEIAKSQNIVIPESRIYDDAFELLKFERELAQISSENEKRRNIYRMYNPMSLLDLQKWTDTVQTHSNHSKIQWRELLMELFDGSGVNFTYHERIIVNEVDFFFNIVKLLDRTPVRVIANYFNWRLVKKMSRDTTTKMRQLAFQFEHVINGLQEDSPRWRDCVILVSNSLSFAAGFSYVNKHFDNEAKTSALRMVHNIREAFEYQVGAVDWMDKVTQEKAKEKAQNMVALIGYPDWYSNITAFKNYYDGLTIQDNHFQNIVHLEEFNEEKSLFKLRSPVDRKGWSIGPDVVNAFYEPEMNSIVFPAGVLQQPFFSKGRIEALNYGSIGVVIGHEVSHGFDDMGRHSDKYGNLAEWWSESTTETYLKKAQCFIDQYNSYRVPQLDNMLHKEVTMNGFTTQGENMADFGGLRQAYHAYKKLVNENGPEPRLPGLEQYSPEQLFFIGFGMVWCESSTKESLLQEVLNDPHSPHQLRIRGTLSNSPEFSEVWNCPVGSTMNPEHKCSMW